METEVREEDRAMQKEDVSVNRSRDADSLRAAFGREGCPVCLVVLEYMRQSIVSAMRYAGTR